MTTAQPIQLKQSEEEKQKRLADLENLSPSAPDPEEEDVETPDVEEDEEQPEAPEGDNDKVVDPEEDVETPDVEEDEEQPEAPEKKPPVSPEKREEDWEEKFKHSSAEAQIQTERVSQYEKRIEEAKNIPAPTDEECLQHYGEEWNDLSPINQRLARESFHNKKKLDLIDSINSEVKTHKERSDAAAAFAVDPANHKHFPKLNGREDEFARFCSRPTRVTLDFEILAGLFSQTVDDRPKAPKKPLIPRGKTSVVKKQPAPTVITAEKANALRNVSPKKHQEMIRTGKIKAADMI